MEDHETGKNGKTFVNATLLANIATWPGLAERRMRPWDVAGELVPFVVVDEIVMASSSFSTGSISGPRHMLLSAAQPADCILVVCGPTLLLATQANVLPTSILPTHA